MRSSELRALTLDAIVQIGSAYWLRIPIGKLHNNRYIPFTQLKDLLDDWIAHHQPARLRSDRLLLERSRIRRNRVLSLSLRTSGFLVYHLLIVVVDLVSKLPRGSLPPENMRR